MTLTLHDHTETIRASRVPADVALDLIGHLPKDIGVHISPDAGSLEPIVKDPGYFGLAVALARKTWT